jgi:hypothetical protein
MRQRSHRETAIGWLLETSRLGDLNIFLASEVFQGLQLLLQQFDPIY